MKNPDTWTPDEWAALQRDLDQLAAEDPAVAAAAKAVDDYIDDTNWRHRHGINKYRPTKGQP